MKNRTFIIGEAGINHNGDMRLAKELIDVAVNSKVDAVKFQVFVPELLITKNTEMAPYQKSNLGVSKSQLDMIKDYELSYEQHIMLNEYCKLKKITYLSSPFDIPSIEFLSNIVPYLKFHREKLQIFLFEENCIIWKKVILSSGMSTLDDINMALEVLTTNGLKINQITVLHCTSNYPCEISDVNLKSMKTIKSTFGVNVGYSDHTLGLEIPIAAVALGATVIEKHFTIDKNLSGPDHKASLEPNELANMVSSIRKIRVCNW